MSTKTMAEVLARHQPTGDDIDDIPAGKIACGWIPCEFMLDDEGDGEWRHEFSTHQAAALTAAGFGLVADAKAEAWDEMVANSPRLPSAVRNVVFEAVFDVVDKFNFPAQNMGYRKDVVEIGDVCGDVEKRIVAIIRARRAAVRGEG